MKNIIVIIICSIFFACTTNTADTKSNDTTTVDTTASAVMNIPFTEAKNYFVKGTFKEDSLSNPKINTQNDFDSIFGMATTMNAQPTPIDFSKQYVLAIIQPLADKATTLMVQSLTQKENTIILNYTKTEGEKQSFTTRPCLLLVVDNKYNGSIIVHQQ